MNKIILLGLGFISAGLGGCRTEGMGEKPALPRRTEVSESSSAEEMFALTLLFADLPLEKKIEAASELARRQDWAAWVVVLLLESFPQQWPDEQIMERELLEHKQQYWQHRRRPLVVAALEALPPNTDNAVLWAVTSHLNDHEPAMYGISRGDPPEHLSFITKPVRDVAREALKRSLGVDRGYSVEAWRREILKRGGAETGSPEKPTALSNY